LLTAGFVLASGAHRGGRGSDPRDRDPVLIPTAAGGIVSLGEVAKGDVSNLR
jgi:hypothetical protein